MLQNEIDRLRRLLREKNQKNELLWEKLGRLQWDIIKGLSSEERLKYFETLTFDERCNLSNLVPDDNDDDYELLDYEEEYLDWWVNWLDTNADEIETDTDPGLDKFEKFINENIHW